VTIDAATDAQRRRILAELAALGPSLPGTLLRRYGRCGTAGCRCHADPPALHGPWWSWTRKVNGKTVTVRLTDEQAHDYQPWIANARRLRELTTELEQLALRAIDADPRTRRQHPTAPGKPTRRHST
jgi:hypothetical protein